MSCQGDLGYDLDDGSLCCPHAKTEAEDPRTAACVRHSIAILLLEAASKL